MCSLNNAFQSEIRILIAEDESNLIVSMEYALRRHGFNVSKAGTGKEALNIIRKCHAEGNPINLLITDVQMPEMNGEELVSAVRSIDTNMAILVITGFGNKEMVIRLMRMGCSDYLDKPFSSETFVKRVLALVEQISAASSQAVLSEQERDQRRFLLERELSLLRSKYQQILGQFKRAEGEYHSLVAIDPSKVRSPVSFRNRPLHGLGGDFAAVKDTERGCIALVADVAGHDLSAAFHTIVIKTFFDEHCDSSTDGAFLMELLNRAIRESGDGERAVTASLLRLDYQEMWAEVTLAASPPVILCREKESIFRSICIPGSLLGLYESITFVSRRIQIMPGDRFVMYTDGVLSPIKINPETGNKIKMAERGIEEILLRQSKGCLDEIVSNVWNELCADGRSKFLDDALLLAIEVPEVQSCF